MKSDTAPSTMLLLVNFVAFQLAWFACAVAAAHGRQWLGVGVIAPVVAAFVWLAPRPARALQLFAVVTLIGTTWDSATNAIGWMHFVGAPAGGWLAPAWIIAMWTLFATLLNVCLRWLRARPLLSGMLGLVGGPLAYYGGARLGAVSFGNLYAALALQGAGWALLTPLLISLGARFEH
jgi:hypothetical protein